MLGYDLCYGDGCNLKNNCKRFRYQKFNVEATAGTNINFWIIQGSPFEILPHGIVDCILFLPVPKELDK